MKRLIALALISSTLTFVTGLTRAEDTASAAQHMSMDELASRLKLTSEQQEKIKPFAEQRRAKLEEIHGKMSSASSRRDKFALMKEAKQVQDEFVAKVEPLLTTDQQTQWKNIRAEARDQMKERRRNRQQSP